MKWTGNGVFSQGGKDYFPGQELPKDAFSGDQDDGKRLAKMKKDGFVDGKMSGDAYERAQEAIEENRKKSGGKESASHKGSGPKTKKQLKAEAEKLNKQLSKLKTGKDDAEISEIEKRMVVIENEYEGAPE